jgi:hypothetical protein
MKAKFILLAMSGSLALGAPVLLAQANLATNIAAGANDIPHGSPGQRQGESTLLPPGLKGQWKLSGEQKSKIKQIEQDFAQTSREYKTANRPRLDAAAEADRQARAAKNPGQIQAAHSQYQQVWAGLEPYRAAAIAKIRLVLTPDQLKLWVDAKH